MPIRKRTTQTTTTVNEEHYVDDISQTTDLPPISYPNTNFFERAERPRKQIETGEPVKHGEETSLIPISSDNMKYGMTYADLISEIIKNPQPEHIITLFVMFGFIFSPKNIGLLIYGEYTTFIGGSLTLIWFVTRRIKKYKK